MSTKTKVSIGLPVYNGEQFIREKLESLISLPFNDFELIISDNASTDSTPLICEEFAKKDNRICYIRQKKNIGPLPNFRFVLEEAKSDYFVWTAVDDKMSPGFLEKNIKILESKKNIVCSISKIERYGTKINMFKPDPSDTYLQKLYKKIRRHFRTYGAVPLSGSFEKKAGIFLRRSSGQSVYGVFRTDLLKNCIEKLWDEKVGFELGVFLNILRHGDLYVLDEVLLFCWDRGVSSTGFIQAYREKRISLLELFFPFFYHFTWCAKNLGIKFILKNLDHFLWLNCWVPIMVPQELAQMLKDKISRSKND